MSESKPLAIKSKNIEDLTHYQESLLKKRRKDDADHRRRVDTKARMKLNQLRQKKIDEKEQAGKNILMPEVFVSNNMKQQRNYVHYKRNKNQMERGEKAATKFGTNAYKAIIRPESQVDENALLMAIRIKGQNQATTPQAQKVLSDMGLRQINNCVFIRADKDNLKKILTVQDYISYGYPTKKMVNDLVRKRGFLKKDDKKLAITDNVLIEELLG